MHTGTDPILSYTGRWQMTDIDMQPMSFKEERFSFLKTENGCQIIGVVIKILFFFNKKI